MSIITYKSNLFQGSEFFIKKEYMGCLQLEIIKPNHHMYRKGMLIWKLKSELKKFIQI